MVVKKNEKKHYYSHVDDTHSIKDLIEEKRREIRAIESRMKELIKSDVVEEDGKETERDRLKKQIKHLERDKKLTAQFIIYMYI